MCKNSSRNKAKLYERKVHAIKVARKKAKKGARKALHNYSRRYIKR